MKKEGILKKFLQRIFSITVCVIASFILLFPQQSQAFPGIITYQGKLTDASGSAVSNGTYSIKFSLYDAASGGSCQYTASGTCGTPTALSVTVTSGVFSVALGGSGTNSLTPSIFQTGDLYLGITVASDSEMTPRKQLTTSPFAYNALYLSGLATSTIGGTSSYIPAANTSGNFVFTGTPQNTTASGGVLYVNPSSAASSYKLIGAAVNGSSRFTVDSEGDISTSGTIHSLDVIPYETDNADLGGTNNKWSTVWTSIVKNNSSGYLKFATTGNIGISSSTPGRMLDVAGGFMVSGSSILGDSTADALTVNATSTFNGGITSQSIIPATTNTYDIGSASTFFRNVYATGTINVTNLTVTGTCTGCSTSAASGFSDGGTLISLTTITDQVGVGTSTAANGVKFHIVNNKDDASLRITAGSSQTRDLTHWVNAASSSILARVTAAGDIMSSSTVQGEYGRFYTNIQIDPNAAVATTVPLLLIGATSAPDYATVYIKRAVSESAGRGQITLSESTTLNTMGIGISDTGYGPGVTEGEGYVNTWRSSIAARLDYGIYAARVRINSIPNNSHSADTFSSSTAALTVNYYSNTGVTEQPATLILQKEGVDRLRVFTTSSQAVTFTANLANALGTSGFVFDQATKISSSTSQSLFAVRNQGTRLMSIDAAGNVYAAGSFVANTTGNGNFPGDLAEYVPVTDGQMIEAGDVLVVDPQNPIKHIKSPGALQTGVAGIVSNTAAFVIGSSENGTRVPLALSGLAYAKASDESGAIAIGDLLVTASKPGYLMKYDPAKHTGQFAIVALAMEPLASGEDKKILTHVRNSYSLPSQVTVTETSSGTLALSSDENPIVQSIKARNNSWSISRDGLLVSNEIETKSLAIIDGGNSESTIGEGYFGPGELVISVLSNKITKDSKVFITFRTDLKGKSYYVSAITPGESFMVTLSSATDDPLVFDWWILQKKSQSLEVLPTEEIPPTTGENGTEVVPDPTTPSESTSSTPGTVVVPDESTTTSSTPDVVEPTAPIPTPTPEVPVVDVPASETPAPPESSSTSTTP